MQEGYLNAKKQCKSSSTCPDRDPTDADLTNEGGIALINFSELYRCRSSKIQRFSTSMSKFLHLDFAEMKIARLICL
jgi:hypothetical protein